MRYPTGYRTIFYGRARYAASCGRDGAPPSPAPDQGRVRPDPRRTRVCGNRLNTIGPVPSPAHSPISFGGNRFPPDAHRVAVRPCSRFPLHGLRNAIPPAAEFASTGACVEKVTRRIAPACRLWRAMGIGSRTTDSDPLTLCAQGRKTAQKRETRIHTHLLQERIRCSDALREPSRPTSRRPAAQRRIPPLHPHAAAATAV